MRTDTISRDDVQDIKIENLNQQMSDRKRIDTEMAKALNAFKDTLSEHVDVNNKNFEIASESIRELTDNQTELNNLIDKTNQSFNRKIKIQNEIVVALSVLLLIVSAILLYVVI